MTTYEIKKSHMLQQQTLFCKCCCISTFLILACCTGRSYRNKVTFALSVWCLSVVTFFGEVCDVHGPTMFYLLYVHEFPKAPNFHFPKFIFIISSVSPALGFSFTSSITSLSLIHFTAIIFPHFSIIS